MNGTVALVFHILEILSAQIGAALIVIGVVLLGTGVGILVNIKAWWLPTVSFPILYFLKPSSCFVHPQVEHSIMLCSAPTAVFMCFVLIREQTAIISLYSIN